MELSGRDEKDIVPLRHSGDNPAERQLHDFNLCRRFLFCKREGEAPAEHPVSIRSPRNPRGTRIHWWSAVRSKIVERSATTRRQSRTDPATPT